MNTPSLRSRVELYTIKMGFCDDQVMMPPLAFLSVVLIVVCLVGCSKVPSAVDHFAKVTELLDRYMNTNAVEAEAAMFASEQFTRMCEKAGSNGIEFDQFYAAVYSRLYLVDKELNKQDAAKRYYQMAAEKLQKMNAIDKKPPLSPAEVRERIEGVDAYFEAPLWKGQSKVVGGNKGDLH